MITYIYQKDSTLWAFEGPEKRTPNIHDYDEDCGYAYDCRRKEEAYNQAMSTARESALPVVNAGIHKAGTIEYAIFVGSDAIQMNPGQAVSLPGWALEKEPLWDDYRKRPSAQNVYRLKRSEPDGIEMNHAVVDEFTKPIPIKLTFYSGKLWHSEKPFPVNEPITHASVVSKVMHSLKIDQWLSTVYEVVNPEVIPITPDGYSTRIKDGDQITLPDGYGIEKHYQPDSGPLVRRVSIILPEKPENSAHGYTDAMKATLSDCPWIKSEDVKSCIRCEGTGETSPDNQCKRCEGTGIEDHQDLCENPITLPEKPEPFMDTKLCPIHQDRNCLPECVNGCVYGNSKPENSAHGYTEGAEVPKEKCKVWCGGYGCLPHHRNLEFEEDKSNCPGDNSTGRRTDGDLMGTQPFVNQDYAGDRIPLITTVEPSESQEEDQIDLLSEILVDYKTWLDDPESGMRDYENFQAKQLEKFTITRK